MARGLTPREVLKKYYPGNYFGFDREDRPVFYDAVGQCDFFGLLHSVKADDIVQYRRELVQEGRQLARQRSQQNGGSNCQSIAIFDLEGLSMKNLWKPGVALFNRISTVIQEEFPDSTHAIIVVNPPSVFPVFFAVVKPFLGKKVKDQIKILSGNWKEDLRVYIHPEQLPRYYGGDVVDGNGSEKCEDHICYGGKVPEELYSRAHVRREEFKIAYVARRSCFVHREEMTSTSRKRLLKWKFMTEKGDIGFQLDHKRSATGDLVNLVKNTRMPSDLLLVEGSVDCEQPGEYLLTFDNKSSWLNGKKLYYSVTTDEKP